MSEELPSEATSEESVEESYIPQSAPPSSNAAADLPSVSSYADENYDAPVGSSTFLEKYGQLSLTKWGELINSLNVENIESIDVLVSRSSEIKRTRTSTFDPEVMREWVELFRSIPVPGEPRGMIHDWGHIELRIYNRGETSYSTSFTLIQSQGRPIGISWVDGPGDYYVNIKEMDTDWLNDLFAKMDPPVWRPANAPTAQFLADRLEEKLHDVDANNVTKFEVVSNEWSDEMSKATTDAELIQKWVTWLHSIEIRGDVDVGFENNGSTSYYYYDAQGQRCLLFTKSSQTIDFSTVDDPHGLQIEQWDSELYQQLWEAMELPTAKS